MRKFAGLNKKISLFFVICFLAVVNCNIYFASENDTAVPILMYHNIIEEYDPETVSANITPELFEKQIRTLLSFGYTPVSMTAYYNYVTGSGELPENPIVITFDDGYLSNYEIAYPILKKYNVPACIFIVTSTVGHTPEMGTVSYPHFTWEQAKEMQDSGLVEINSHTHSHKNIAGLTTAELQKEIRLSKYLIEKNLNKYCYTFAYPYGGYREDTERLIRYAGYKMHIKVYDSSAAELYAANTKKDGLTNIKRITVRGDMSELDLIEAVKTAIANTKQQ